MIELSKLTKRERTLISIQCDRFFLTISKSKHSLGIFNKLKEDIGLCNRYNKELWCFITCVGKSLRSGNNGSQYPLKSSYYTKANSVHDLGLNHRRSSEVIRLLDEKGWITFYKGYKDVKNEDNLSRSCIIFSDKLKSLYTCNVLKSYSDKIPVSEMLVVKDSKTKESFMKLTKFKGVSSQRDFMIKFNKLLSNSKIEVMDHTCAVTYKQVFADDLSGAGRLYTFGSFQSMDVSLRKLIKLNGEDTTEVDVRGIHPAICRLAQGLDPVPITFDPYDADINLDIEKKEFRLLCKYAMMCMINCKTKHGSKKALMNVFKKDKNKKDRQFPSLVSLSDEQITNIIDALEHTNSPVIFHGKGSLDWKELQRYDSRVCEGVITKFIDKGIPILAWHDSFVCQARYQAYLKYCIKESWFEVFNTYGGCVLKVEF